MLRNNLIADFRSLPLAFKALLLLVFVSIGRPQDVFPYIKPFHIGDIAVILIFASLFYIRKDQINNRILGYTEAKLVTLLFILMIALVPFALVKMRCYYFITDSFVKTFIFFIITVKLTKTIKDVKYISWVLVLSMLSLSIGVFLVKGEPLTRASGRISFGTMYDPNDLAMTLVTLLPIAMMFSFYTKGFQRVFGLISTCLGLFCITLTQSRGGFLGLITITFMIFFSKSRFKIKYLIILLLLSVLFITFVPKDYVDRISTIIGGEGGGSRRTLVWKRSLRIISSNPFGYGAGNFASAYGRYIINDPDAEADSGGYMTYAWKTAHNSFILITVELGVLGLAVYVFLIYKVYNNFRRIKKTFTSGTIIYQYAEFLRISLVGFLVCGFFLSQSYSPLFFLICAVSSVMVNVIAKEIENEKGIIL